MKISVIIPMYNSKDTIKSAIESVLNQTYKEPIEIIVVNDGSKDGCEKIVEKMIINNQTNRTIKLINKPNGGVSSARNRGIKEASGDISQIAQVAALCGDKIHIYSGNDDQIVPIMALGGIGVISVVSNVMPKETAQICESFLNGHVKESLDLQLKLLPFINSLFTEVNPIPVKAALSAMGFCEDNLRLPLTCMESENREKMYTLMKELGLKFV